MGKIILLVIFVFYTGHPENMTPATPPVDEYKATKGSKDYVGTMTIIFRKT